MACDNLFFRRVGALNRSNVPAVALVVQGIWAAFLTLPRTVITNPQTGAVTYGNVYTQLLEYIISADLIFYALMVGAVIVMRRKAPEVERPYRTWGYPLVPLVYIGLAVLIVLDLAFLAPSTSGIGYLLVLTGIPVYFVWREKIWSALTCQRFGRARLSRLSLRVFQEAWHQVATDKSGDRSPHSKSFHPFIRDFGFHFHRHRLHIFLAGCTHRALNSCAPLLQLHPYLLQPQFRRE